MIARKKHPSPWYNMHDVSRGRMPTDKFSYRLELSHQGYPTTFFCKFVQKEQKLPRNLLNLGKASLFFSFKVVKRAYENRNGEDLLTASECWEFFLAFEGKSNYSPSSAMKPYKCNGCFALQG